MKKSKLTIKDWAEEDRPREKLLIKGRKSLSNAELIAILLGSGSTSFSALDLSKQILSRVDQDLHKLAQLEISDLKEFKGIGEAKAISIVSALELGRRRKFEEALHREKVTTSQQVYELMKEDLHDLRQEEFWVILLRRNNTVISKEQISKGGISGTVVDPKVIFQKALKESASGVVLCHNHPSGNRNPSRADITLTKKISEGGQLLEINVLDHVIYTNTGYFSFADEEMI